MSFTIFADSWTLTTEPANGIDLFFISRFRHWVLNVKTINIWSQKGPKSAGQLNLPRHLKKADDLAASALLAHAADGWEVPTL